ncbi:MAG TPA: DUF938 domain-containing protein [Sphingomicrobium sp.]|nr:DUF938 domain-containing protein [Sphingomicrobium sp.]
MTDGRRFYEEPAAGVLRSAPAALRNRQPIADVLAEWLPAQGLVLELASGTGEHVVYFGEHFPALDWQPSDVDADSIRSVAARVVEAGLPNVRPPLIVDASSAAWPIERADAVLSINMVHISPWAAALGLIRGAARVLREGSPLVLYGPWLKDDIPTAPGNLEFDASLKRRDPDWGLRRVEDFCEAAARQSFRLESTRTMPANNLMMLLRR